MKVNKLEVLDLTTIHEKLKTIQDAINYEIDQHYINAKGKKTTFSNFIIQSTKSLSFDIEDKTHLKSLINLFFSYPSQDITGRMYTIHKAQELLKELSGKTKSKKRLEDKEQEAGDRRQETGSRKQETGDRKQEAHASCLMPPAEGEARQGRHASLPPAQQGEARSTERQSSFTKDLKKLDVKYIKGIGPKISLILNKIGIFSVYDLLHYYPRDYIDYQKHLPIKDLRVDDNVTVTGTISNVKYFSTPKRKDLTIFTTVIKDDTGKISVTKFFGGRNNKVIVQQYKKQHPIGAQVICSGTVSYDKFSRGFSLANAAMAVIDNTSENKSSLNLARIVPIYPLTENISNEFIRKTVSNGFDSYGDLVQETLPKEIIDEVNLLDLKTSLHHIHFPESKELCSLAKRRIVFDEFFKMQLELAYRRYQVDKSRSGLLLKEGKGELVKKLIDSLPFKLTSAQERVFDEIKKDLMSDKPMHRLLQGDVGSGKTIVALLALLFAVENDYQTALMAPTEILVYQHARKFQEYLKLFDIQVAVLTGSTPNKIKKEIYSGLENGYFKIVVGTHALIQDDVVFNNLGLAIIDEQHRFGVKQRDVLLKKGKNVERLFMTATPIPRTLALSLHGDLELSEIDELPKGRIPIKTSLVQSWQRPKMFDLIRGEVAKGRQAYIVFPLIDESEKLAAKAATIEFEELSKSAFKDLRLGLMHGELATYEKDKTMMDFVNGNIDILVTTTVIEVGVDVSNATVIVIENAERFGLSQLHQLRGRVGRGGEQAYCLLVPQSYSEDALKRLEIMTKTNDGFIIAQEDLRIRGPGEFLGTKQSGLPELHLADLILDADILSLARKKALEMIQKDPEFKKYHELKNLISKEESSYIAAG